MPSTFHWQTGSDVAGLGGGLLRDVAGGRRLEIAVAWLTPGPLLDALLKKAGENVPITVRLTLQGFLTHPKALMLLLNSGITTLVWGTNRELFHPKVYVIEKHAETILWVGSQNATDHAFSQNCEAAARIAPVDQDLRLQVQSFLGNVDCCCRRLTNAIIKNYATKWQQNHEQRTRQTKADQTLVKPIAPVTEQFCGNLGALGNADWSEYYRLLLDAGKKQANDKNWVSPDPLADPHSSFLTTIDQTREVLLNKPPAKIDREDCQRILGCWDQQKFAWNYGYLGSMNANGKITNGIFENTAEFRDQVLAICRDPKFWCDAESSLAGVAALCCFDGVATGFATRLGAILRPDLLVSVNGASAERLSRWSGVPKSPMRDKAHACDGYRELMQFIWRCKWFKCPAPAAPRNSLAYRCWAARCALLDIFMYEETPELG